MFFFFFGDRLKGQWNLSSKPLRFTSYILFLVKDVKNTTLQSFVQLGNVQTKLFRARKENFTVRNVERHLQKNQKLIFRLGVKRWRGPSLPIAPLQTAQYYSDAESVVI